MASPGGSAWRFSVPAVGALVAVCAIAPGCLDEQPAPPSAPPALAGTAETVLRDELRALWTENAVSARVFVVDRMTGSGDSDTASRRLLASELALARAFAPFVDATTMERLVTEFGNAFTDMAAAVDASVAEDSRALDQATADWLASADQIARLLATANPSWSEPDLAALLHESSKRMLQEISARWRRELENEIDWFDAVASQSVSIADALADGLTAGFPRLVIPADPARNADDALHLAMRRLAEDDAAWTRFLVVATTARLPEAELTKQRLLRNPIDTRNVLRPYLGANSEVLAGLSEAQIEDAGRFVDAAARGDQGAAFGASAAWNADADRIASFLAELYPALHQGDLGGLLRARIGSTSAQVTARLASDWAVDAQAYDRLERETLELSTTLSRGVQARSPAGPAPPM